MTIRLDPITACLALLGGRPVFRVYGRDRSEADWRVIDVYATRLRNAESGIPLCAGTCITWGQRLISVGWDFASAVLREQADRPADRDHPVDVAGGRVGDSRRRLAAGSEAFPTASEVLAHECGHTAQAYRWGPLYLPLVGSVTLFREGGRWWNHFENQASAGGQFGGIVPGSVDELQMSRWRRQGGGGGSMD